ncbi:MAG: HYR domain-containing protein, partial [Planctomycetota bacterium]
MADTGVVQDINVRVRLNHTFDSDLVISLVAPDNTVVALANARGGSGDNFGSGTNDCSGTPTIFDDAAGTAISAGTAPFAGTFRPDSLLSAMNGKPSNGTWKVRVADTATIDTGTIGCVTLEITRASYVCCTQGTCVVTCPTNITVPNDANQCSALVNYPAPTTTGNCGTVICSPPSGSTFNVGTTTVTCMENNNLVAGGGTSCSFTVTVQDTQPPAITCPANVTVSNDFGQCSAAVTYTTPTPTDNCPGATVSCVPASGSTFQVGTTTVTCTAQDASPNSANTTCTFTVTVQDTEPPAITCPANITVPNAANQCSAVVSYTTPTPTDNCPGATASCTPASGSTFAVGTTTVTCTASDASPNSANATCTFTVTVQDTQAPSITCPANQTAVSTDGNPVTVNFPAPTVTDNCPGIPSPTCVPASGSSFPVGTTTVTCTASDASPNSSDSTCTFTVTVTTFTPAPTANLADPLACTGPGNKVNGSVSLTNTTVIAQTGTVTTALPASIVGLANTCAANFGSCTVSATTVSWSGTIPAGQTLNISYMAQIADNVVSGTTACVTTVATFNAVSGTVQACLTVNCPTPGPGLIFPAASEASDQGAGSVLIYNIYTSGATSGNTQNTRVNITNVHPTLPAFVHLFFVSEGCSVADSYVCLTGNQTASFLASDLDPGVTGYLVAIAVDGVRGCPTNFNYLIGDEYVKFTTGHSANLGAEAISALAGGLPLCDGNSV